MPSFLYPFLNHTNVQPNKNTKTKPQEDEKEQMKAKSEDVLGWELPFCLEPASKIQNKTKPLCCGGVGVWLFRPWKPHSQQARPHKMGFVADATTTCRFPAPGDRGQILESEACGWAQHLQIAGGRWCVQRDVLEGESVLHSCPSHCLLLQ